MVHHFQGASRSTRARLERAISEQKEVDSAATRNTVTSRYNNSVIRARLGPPPDVCRRFAATSPSLCRAGSLWVRGTPHRVVCGFRIVETHRGLRSWVSRRHHRPGRPLAACRRPCTAKFTRLKVRSNIRSRTGKVSAGWPSCCGALEMLQQSPAALAGLQQLRTERQGP